MSVLSNNAISSLATLVPLEALTSLRHLSLIANPVTALEHYQEFTVFKVGLLPGRSSLRYHNPVKPTVKNVADPNPISTQPKPTPNIKYTGRKRQSPNPRFHPNQRFAPNLIPQPIPRPTHQSPQEPETTFQRCRY